MTALERMLAWRLENAVGEQARCYLVPEGEGYLVSVEETRVCTRAFAVDSLEGAIARCLDLRDDLIRQGWHFILPEGGRR
jgi:hypothetical protein